MFCLTKIQQKGALHGKILEFFLHDTLKNDILNGKVNQKMTQSRPFFLKAIHFYEFSRRAGEVSPLPTS